MRPQRTGSFLRSGGIVEDPRPLREVWTVFRFSRSLRRSCAAVLGWHAARCSPALRPCPGQARRPLCGDARRHPARQGRLGRSTSPTIEYVAAASGMTTGLVRVFTGGQGSGARAGLIVSGNFVPASYSVSMTPAREPRTCGSKLRWRNVKEFSITAGNAAVAQGRSGHRGASPQRDRSDDCLSAARCREGRSARSGDVQASHWPFSTAASVTIWISPTSAWTR